MCECVIKSDVDQIQTLVSVLLKRTVVRFECLCEHQAHQRLLQKQQV